jgi:creatinine amidohydrolase/Fe(II)-dependent formamide hydrolase-like protein
MLVRIDEEGVMKRTVRRLLASALAVLSTAATAQVYRVAEMNAAQIGQLDRARTAVILTGGILEEHGPLLPAGTDTLMNEWWTQALAEAIVARPGWKVLLFPTIPLGTSGANVLGGRHMFPGSYTVRPDTERAIYMDLASALGEQGFRWIFVMHNHGSPLHNLMLDQAGDYFHDTYGGTMLNLPGLLLDDTEASKARPADVVREEGRFEVHAGMSETSRILFLRPDLVAPGYASAPPNTADAPADAARIARAPGWQGYIGSPRLASSAFGAREMRQRAELYNRTALAVLDGADPSRWTRLSAVAFKDPVIDGIERGTRAEADRIAQAQRAWLKRHEGP